MFKTAGTLAIAVALLLPLSACGSTPATSAAPSSPVVTAAPAIPEPAPVTSESSSSPSVAVPTPSPSETDAPLLMAKNSSPLDDAPPEQTEEMRRELCLGGDGGPPLLQRVTLNKRGFQIHNKGGFYFEDPAVGRGVYRVLWQAQLNGLEYMLGRLTEADLEVGKIVYYLDREEGDPVEYRDGSSPTFNWKQVPGHDRDEVWMFPASACAGLRD